MKNKLKKKKEKILNGLIYFFSVINIILACIYIIMTFSLNKEAIKESSLFDNDITAKYGEQLITLVTCSYHVEDGRFVVIGKEK